MNNDAETGTPMIISVTIDGKEYCDAASQVEGAIQKIVDDLRAERNAAIQAKEQAEAEKESWRSAAYVADLLLQHANVWRKQAEQERDRLRKFVTIKGYDLKEILEEVK